MRRSLLEVMRQRVVLGDGGIGTELQRAGLPAGSCGEAWNVDRPDAVRSIHTAYAAAGAEVLLTNTFGGSRLALDRHGEGARARQLNRAGAELARSVTGNDGWVLGDIGPFGGFIEPLGDVAAAAVEAAFREQAEALLEGGVDGVLIETMSALEEAVLAVRAALAAGARLVIASMAFDATRVGARTMMGVSPADAARTLASAGAHALGANCGSGLELDGYADVLMQLGEHAPDVPLLCRPNAGTPRIEQGAVLYPLTPERLANEAAVLVDAGARLVGGCCGTGPAHIAALRGTVLAG